MSLASSLHDHFGFATFRAGQEEAIQSLLNKQHTLAIMPTGAGKSLIYQLAALQLDGLTLVISPLIALMKDQVDALNRKGIPATFINSAIPTAEQKERLTLLSQGKYRLVYVAPERLRNVTFLQALQNLTLSLLAVDEAHCISEWGHDFRPEYRQLAEVRKKFPSAVCMALTATATPRVRADIMSTLGFSQANEFQSSFNRENLFIEVMPKRDPVAQTLRFLENFKDQSGIIYCFSRRQVDELADALARHGFSVRPYHAGLEDSERKRNQEAFIRDDVQIIVATIAFGMGINKPNVRFVIHFDLPKNIESYYQEIGRAGRDGLPSRCLLLYSYGDASKIRYFIDQKEDPERSAAYQHLDAMTRYAEGGACRRKPLLAYFGETFVSENCGTCDNCGAEQTTQVDITIPAQKFLSCVKRSNERFGAAHIVDILLGSKNEKIEKYKHHELSTYGIGKELTKSQWMHISRQLVERGLLEQEPAYRVLSVTAKGLEMLKSREQVKGQINEANKSERAGARVKSASTEEAEYDKSLFALLRNKRKELADASNVPPYVIFSDKTLAQMASYFPQTKEGLLNMSGMGKVKYERYGTDFLRVIKEYCGENRIEEKFKAPMRDKDDAGRRYMVVGEAYNAGESIENLMRRYDVTADTILNHLARFIMAGNPLRSAEDLIALSNLSPDQQLAVFKTFDTMGSDMLKPIYDKFNNTISYDELRILRLCYLCEER